jgi:hypothetical protein
MVLKIKTSFLYFIKKLFNLSVSKLLIFLSFFLFSCSSYSMQAEEIKPEAASCNISRSISEKKDFEILTIKNKNFNQRLNKIGFNNQKLKYNLFITNGTKPSAGYSLKFDKIIKNKNKFKIYLIETKPNKMSANAAVLIYPFCLLKVDNLDKIEVIIK